MELSREYLRSNASNQAFLEALDRRELQDLAKSLDVRANAKSEVLVRSIIAEAHRRLADDAETLDRPPPLSDALFPPMSESSDDAHPGIRLVEHSTPPRQKVQFVFGTPDARRAAFIFGQQDGHAPQHTVAALSQRMVEAAALPKAPPAVVPTASRFANTHEKVFAGMKSIASHPSLKRFASGGLGRLSKRVKTSAHKDDPAEQERQRLVAIVKERRKSRKSLLSTAAASGRRKSGLPVTPGRAHRSRVLTAVVKNSLTASHVTVPPLPYTVQRSTSQPQRSTSSHWAGSTSASRRAGPSGRSYSLTRAGFDLSASLARGTKYQPRPIEASSPVKSVPIKSARPPLGVGNPNLAYILRSPSTARIDSFSQALNQS